jgi:small subunit ribosomal protein S6e
LTKKEDVRKYVVRRKIPGKDGKPDRFKSPKIQRLITPVMKARKKQRLALKRQRYEKATAEAAEYQKILAQRRQSARAALLSKKRELKSEKKSVKAVPAATGAAKGTKGKQ